MLKRRKRQLIYLAIPGLLMILFFRFIPIINGFKISFYSWNGYGKTMKFVGLDNFIALFSDQRLLRTTVNTLIYGFGSCFLENIFGLLLALFVAKKFRGKNGIRAIVYMPIMISPFIMGKIMHYMFDYNSGVMNDILNLFGYSNVYWLGNSWVSVIIITVANSWQYVGGCMLHYLAGLMMIPSSYLEAAKVDGATNIQCFFKIQLPMLIPSITICVVNNLINSLKLYEMVVGLTGGGPNRETMSLSQYIQILYFNDEKAGYAAAVGLFMFVLIVLIAMPINKYLRSREVYS